jgi:hypothetical protein
MNALQSNMRGWLLWVLPFAALLALIGWQTQWGERWHWQVPAESVATPQKVAAAVLPEYHPKETPDTNHDIVERTLFNPTRRPAPAAVAETAKPRLQRGQFALSGTMVVDGKATAFLRETAGGRSRRVTQGETINGMVVTEIKTDRVRLSLGDESEDLALKVASGPKTTVQPVAANVPPTGPGSASRPGGAQAADAAGRPPTTPQDIASVLAERRRAAREAEAAAAARNTATAAGLPQPNPGMSAVPPPAAAVPQAPDPQWGSVYQRYQQPRR